MGVAMIKLMTLLSVLSAVFCQYQRESPAYDDYSPQQYFYSGPVTYQPQQQRSATYGPAPVHYVNIGAELAGDYKFGYDTGKGDDGQSFREETRLPDGTVQGSYGYTDESGKQRIVKYIAGRDGYKVLKDERTGGASARSSIPASHVMQPVTTYNAPSSQLRNNEVQPEYSQDEAQVTEIPPEPTYRQTARQQPRSSNQRSSNRLYRHQARVPAARVSAVEQYAPQNSDYDVPKPQTYSLDSATNYDPQRNSRNNVEETRYRSNVPSETRPRTSSETIRSRSYSPEARPSESYTPVARSRSSDLQTRSRISVVRSRSRNQIPRRRYVPRPVPDYDYEDNDVTERRLAPIDTTLLSYNIGTSNSDKLTYFNGRY